MAINHKSMLIYVWLIYVHADVHEDPCHFLSSYHLSEEKVEIFKHDIKPKANKSKWVHRYPFFTD